MADAPSAGESPEADLAFGHYRVRRHPDGSIWELGRGGMGVTYKAFDEQLRIDVALKVISPGQVDDPKSQSLFLREARAAARVHHTNVASVVHLNTTPGNFFYAMEFVAGESLAEWLRDRGPLPPAMALSFGAQVARGLAAIHEQHIVHRDLKPANLMIVPAGRDKLRAGSETNAGAWQIKIIDFGLARRFDGEGPATDVDARTTGFRGTTLYASPEQCEERRDLDGRSDQYSLGCVLWEMLTGSPPFRSRSHRELMNQHVAVPAPLERVSHLPVEVREVLARMLEKEPANRFPDAEAAAAALERCRERMAAGSNDGDDPGFTSSVDTISVEPAPASTARSLRFARLRPVGIGLVGAAILMAGASWLLLRNRGPAAAAVVPNLPAAAATETVPAPADLQRKTIAVLPFQNLSGRPEDAYLADGLQEEILNALARLRDLKVISRTSVMEYRASTRNIREIGQRLGAGTILEGSVRREGSKVRLTVQLIDAKNDEHWLAASYDRELNKVLDLQSAVAKQVADALAATLTRQERGEMDRVATNNGDAYDRYLRAIALYRQPVPDDSLGLVEPKRLLEEAIRLDPDYAEAYALLSRVNTQSYFNGRLEDGAAAKLSLEQAFAKDPKSPEALLARGLYAMYVTQNLDQALVDMKAVVDLRPNSSEALQMLGFALRRSGHMNEALAYFARARDLDPLNLVYAIGSRLTLLGLRRYPEALVENKRYSAQFPNDSEAYSLSAQIQARIEGSSEPLKLALREAGNQLTPIDRAWLEIRIAVRAGRFLDAARLVTESPSLDNPLHREFFLGCLYFAAGDADRANESFRRAEENAFEQRKSDPTREPTRFDFETLALVQSMLGKHENALATIEAAVARHPEARDATNGPGVSFVRSIILVRAGQTEKGYAEVARLLHVPFGAPNFVNDDGEFIAQLMKGDPQFDELINHPPRL